MSILKYTFFVYMNVQFSRIGFLNLDTLGKIILCC